MARTLAQLRAEAQQRCNQDGKTLVGTTDWNRYVNEAIAELYDLVIAANPHYYVSSSAFTLSSVNSLDLTTLTPTFYKLRGVDYNGLGNRPVTVRPYNFAERNRFTNLNFSGPYTAWWTPAPPTLANDNDPLDIILDVWSEFVAVTAAIVGAVKEDSADTANNLAQAKAGLVDRIGRSAPNRDGEPGQAADLTGLGYGYMPGDCGRRYALEGQNLTILGSSWEWPY